MGHPPPVSRRAWIVVGVLLGVSGLACAGAGLAAWLVWGDGEAPPERRQVTVPWPGASPSEVDAELCGPLTDRLGSDPGVARAVGVAQPSLCTIEVTLAAEGQGVDLPALAEAVRAGVPDAEAAVVTALPTGPHVDYVLVGDAHPAELRAVHDERLRPALERMAGVEGIDTCGGGRTVVEVRIRPHEARALGVTIDDVLASLRADVDIPGLGPGDDRAEPGSLGAVALRHADGPPVRLSDVATVSRGATTPDCIARWGGRRVMAGRVRLSADADPEAVRAAVRDADLGEVRARPFDGETIQVSLPPGTGDEELEHQARAVAEAVHGDEDGLVRVVASGADPFATGYAARLGHPSIGVQARAPERSRALEALHGIPGLAVARSPGDLVLWIGGADRQTLRREAERLAGDIGELPGTRAVGVFGASEIPDLAVRLDAPRAAAAGVDGRTVATTVRAATVGVDVRPGVKLFYGDGRGPELLEQLVVPTSAGEVVPLGAVARLERDSAPLALVSMDGRPAVAIRVAVDPDTRTAVRSGIGALDLPAGVWLELE